MHVLQSLKSIPALKENKYQCGSFGFVLIFFFRFSILIEYFDNFFLIITENKAIIRTQELLLSLPICHLNCRSLVPASISLAPW